MVQKKMGGGQNADSQPLYVLRTMHHGEAQAHWDLLTDTSSFLPLPNK
jgi:hypothetical protein